MSFHITLTTTDATIEKSNNNNNHSLKLHFTKPIRLHGEWEVAIVNWISDDDAKRLVWIFCDFVNYSLINNIPMQFLGIENDTSSSSKPMYIKVCKKMFSNINIQIKHSPLAQELVKVKNFTCILYFRKA